MHVVMAINVHSMETENLVKACELCPRFLFNLVLRGEEKINKFLKNKKGGSTKRVHCVVL